MKYHLFIGRWSPFHNGHKYIIDSVLKSGHNVCIAIRDTPQSEQDPYPALIRKEMIEAVYGEDPRVKIIIIPDIEMVCVGRGVGYLIMRVPEEVENISATKIRGKECSDVPQEVQLLIEVWENSKQ